MDISFILPSIAFAIFIKTVGLAHQATPLFLSTIGRVEADLLFLKESYISLSTHSDNVDCSLYQRSDDGDRFIVPHGVYLRTSKRRKTAKRYFPAYNISLTCTKRIRLKTK